MKTDFDWQVKDDIDLLQQMLKDLDQADQLYKPTNYWKVYEKVFLKELNRLGLHDFRKRRFSILESFNATDTLLRGQLVAKTKFYGSGRVSNILSRMLWNNRFFPMLGLTSGAAEELTQYFYPLIQNKFQQRGYDLAKSPTSKYGNPEDLVEIDEAPFSLMHLNYCSMFADSAQYIPFQDGMFFCELGAGLGRNIEILAHLFPNATILLFDIPPQLYVSNQYLSSVFGDRVVPYREAVSLSCENSDDFKNSIRGRIIILPTWSLPVWSQIKIDIFWNSASFQEMEPNVVINYLRLVKQMAPEYIYINALPGGNYWGEGKPEQGGTVNPVISTYYLDSLKEIYSLIAEYDTEYFLRANTYRSYIYKKHSC